MTDIDCPRAKTPMTPCIARDGRSALDDPPRAPARYRHPQCVGCGANARDLLMELSGRYEPARKHRQTHDQRHCADLLKRFVAEYVNQGV